MENAKLYQYALSDSLEVPFLAIAAAAEEIYSSTPLNPLNTPSGAKIEGAFVVGKSPQQLSAKFLISCSTNSIFITLKISMAFSEAGLSSIIRTGLRLFIKAHFLFLQQSKYNNINNISIQQILQPVSTIEYCARKRLKIK
jgi:hypothetical protein